MDVREFLKSGIVYLDGGTGSILQERGLKPGELPEMWNITRPGDIVDIAKEYYRAGSNIVYANTFGCNSLKYDGKEGRPGVEKIVTAAIKNTRQAAEEISREQDADNRTRTEKFVALDMGSCGKMLKPLGDTDFETVVALFAEVVRAGDKAGADIIVIETMNDCYETKAAVLAAKENSSLPILVTTVYDESAKLMTGATPEAMVAMLEGLRVDALGANCSLGPEQMLPIAERLYKATSLPLVIKPNAGMPSARDGKTVYDVDADSFSDIMVRMVAKGARILGGCCGTRPDYIYKTVQKTCDIKPLPIIERDISVVSSYAMAVDFNHRPLLIGERINPTGKKKFKEALRDHDIGYVLNEGVKQMDCGADILDVNVGLPEIDEVSLLSECVQELQSVISLPLQIDTTDPDAMERALRIYNGKAMVNSVNGKDEVMDRIFPIVQKYGGLVVCLTLDEDGIPESSEKRVEIAKKIIKKAESYGIRKKDLIFDPLAMAISSDNKAGLATLEAVGRISRELGAKTSLGISNVSFGLPCRDFITSAFFLMNLQNGLSAAIMNPFSFEMKKTYKSFLALSGLDDNCRDYIDFASGIDMNAVNVSSGRMKEAFAKKDDDPGSAKDERVNGLMNAIVKGLKDEAGNLAREALTGDDKTDGLTLINEQIVPALDMVGVGFEKKTMFLPQLLMSAEAAKMAFDEVRKTIPAGDTTKESVIVATVKGDIHDIGKNIVKVILENYGYRVIDLGRDVPPESIVEAALANNIKLVGLSALMTTTVPAMEETIKQLRKAKPDCRVVVGGAVLTQEYADMIGADKYAGTAMDTVRYAEELFA